VKKPPPFFHMLRAAFWLLTAVVGTELILTLVAGSGCIWLIISGTAAIGSCTGLVGQIREVWAEVLAAILALLLASRNGNGPPPPPPPME
jgi:hypothetical protein